jgi:hypothetical protein
LLPPLPPFNEACLSSSAVCCLKTFNLPTCAIVSLMLTPSISPNTVFCVFKLPVCSSISKPSSFNTDFKPILNIVSIALPNKPIKILFAKFLNPSSNDLPKTIASANPCANEVIPLFKASAINTEVFNKTFNRS